MLHSRELELDVPDTGADPPVQPDVRVSMADRSAPRWALVLGASFGLSIYLCALAVILLSLLFHSAVIQTGESRMALVLLVVGLCFLAGVTVLELAHARSLKGFRWLREQLAQKIAAALAIPVALTIFFVHPLAGAVIPLSVGLGWLVQWQLARAHSNEPAWAFLPEEAVSLLAGRDGNGVAQAMVRSTNHAFSAPLRRVVVGLALLISFAVAAYLISELVLAPGVMLPLALICGCCVNDVLIYTGSLYSHEPENPGMQTRVLKAGKGAGTPGSGLVASGIGVRNKTGQTLLSDVSISVDPGEVVGIIGESGAGKSLLLSSLADPFSLIDVDVDGQVSVNGTDLWQRSSRQQSVPAVYVSEPPVILPMSGAENLSCLQGEEQLKRGRYFLEQMVFAHDLVEDICQTPDARLLPSMQRKALALSRAFALSPSVYFLDRPEDALQATQVSALCSRIDQETRLGRSFVLVSDNRALLEKCDRLFVLQNGTLVDFGPADQVRERRASGWHRFIGQRSFESEANLKKWVRSHFRRDGDEPNRRKATQVALELLAVSCREASPSAGETVEFLFKNFKGHCVIQMMDRSAPLSSGEIQKAKELASSKPLGSRRNPLANILAQSLDVEFESHLDGRLIRAKVETFDPRKTGAASD